MVDLQTQYQRLKNEIDSAVLNVMESCQFIGGPEVNAFKEELEAYLGVKHVIPCANGTDALQIALMALGLKAGDEVIVPTFTYVATAEVIALLGLTPVLVDVDRDTFLIDIDQVSAAISSKTKAIVPVHLFGQCANMEKLLTLTKDKGIAIVEDNAQAIGANHRFSDGSYRKSGTMGEFGCTSFFPSKNLGCFGDGGALFTNDDELAAKAKMIASHGQSKQYVHDVVGCNSRLDAIQAALLRVKLRHLDDFNRKRQEVAKRYDDAFSSIHQLKAPTRVAWSDHVFHQYTLTLNGVDREELREHLKSHGIPSMVYYPIPLHKQKAFESSDTNRSFKETEYLCEHVLSLPIHTEMDENTQRFIIEKTLTYLQKSK